MRERLDHPLNSKGNRIFNKLRGLFNIDTEKTEWKGDIDVGPFIDNFHSPLAQLWFLFQYGGGVDLDNIRRYEARYTDRSCKIQSCSFRSADIVETSVYPVDILDLILANKLSSKTGFKGFLLEQVRDAKRIMLAGSLNLLSATSLIMRLETLGFHGEIDIYDLSEVPLILIEAYKETGFWNKTGIKINNFRRDLTVLEEEGDYDIVFADVLIHYLNDQCLKSALEGLNKVSKDEGLILLRDMITFPDKEERGLVIRNKREEFLLKKGEKSFIEWLRKYFGIKITLDQLKYMRENLFNIPILHGNRDLSFFEKELFRNPIYEQLTTPVINQGQRFFPIFVFKKGLKTRSFIYDFNHQASTKILRNF